MTEVADVVPSELRVRLRPAAAAAAQKKPPPRSPLNILKPENEASTSEEATPPEEANRSERPAAGDAGVEGDEVGCLKKPESVHEEKVRRSFSLEANPSLQWFNMKLKGTAHTKI